MKDEKVEVGFEMEEGFELDELLEEGAEVEVNGNGKAPLKGYVVPYFRENCEFCKRAAERNKAKAQILRMIGAVDEAAKLEKRQMCRIHSALARIRYLRRQAEAERQFMIKPVEPGKVRVQVGYTAENGNGKSRATLALTITKNGIFAITNGRAARVDTRFLNILTSEELAEIAKALNSS